MPRLETAALAEIVQRTWNVIVVGAGVAGSVAAYGLARAGLEVLLVDKAVFPRWKVCGACLNPAALAALESAALGDLPDRCGAIVVRQMCLAVPGHRAAISLPGWKVLSRERFDAALAEAAVDAGATFLPNTCASLGPVEQDVRTIRLRRGHQEETIRARLVLAAVGLGGRLLTSENPGDSIPALGSRVGAGVVVDEAPDFYHDGAIYMAYGKGGYIGLARREDGRLNLAAAFDVGQLRTLHSPCAAAVKILADVGWPPISELADLSWRGTPPLTRCTERPAAERVLAIGDAAGYVEPFTGEGIGWALASGIAVVPLAIAAVQDWQHSVADAWVGWHRQTSPSRQRLCRAIAWLSRHPRMAHAAVALLSRFPGLAGPFVRHASRPAGAIAGTRIAHAGDPLPR